MTLFQSALVRRVVVQHHDGRATARVDLPQLLIRIKGRYNVLSVSSRVKVRVPNG
jgi:hypothetical protein